MTLGRLCRLGLVALKDVNSRSTKTMTSIRKFHPSGLRTLSPLSGGSLNAGSPSLCEKCGPAPLTLSGLWVSPLQNEGGTGTWKALPTCKCPKGFGTLPERLLCPNCPSVGVLPGPGLGALLPSFGHGLPGSRMGVWTGACAHCEVQAPGSASAPEMTQVTPRGGVAGSLPASPSTEEGLAGTVEQTTSPSRNKSRPAEGPGWKR